MQEAQYVVGTLTQIISELNVATSPSSWKICPEIYSVWNCGGLPWGVSYWEINDLFIFFLSLKKGQILMQYWIAYAYSNVRPWQLILI